MKCKRPMAHRPAMEGVNNCKDCEREERESTRLVWDGRRFYRVRK